MHIRGLVFWLVFNVYWGDASSSEYRNTEHADGYYKTSNESPKTTPFPSDVAATTDGAYDTCSIDDFTCLAMAQSDRLGLEAIKSLHKQLDDDQDGNIDLSESDDVLKELWEAWLRSEVHNWTVEQTTDWLTTYVDLPQYVSNFMQYKVTGANLPRLAVNNANYLAVLGIKDPIHKQKIALKAMDVVLFGPPKDVPHWKDLTLIFLTIVGGLGVWYAFQQNKKFKSHLNRMNKDMDSLQNAEKALENLQKELEQAKQAQESVITEKQNLEKKLQDSKSDFSSLPSSYSDLEVSQLKAEIECEKLRKKRSSLVGAFVSTHGKSIDEVDRSIVEARTSLTEVTQELQERAHRWKQIELLCGFNIINNNGYVFLENALYRNGNGRGIGLRGRMSSTDDLDDETGSVYGNYPGYMESSHLSLWKDGDSSSSETSKQDDEVTSGTTDLKGPTRNNVQFLVGGEVSQWTEESLVQNHAKNIVGRLSSHPKNTMAPKSSLSDTCLDTNKVKPVPIRPITIKEQPSVSLEDDVCSTDSSVLDENDVKKKKRKLFTFSKKSKNKGD
ncbi:hypothetical protein NQ314_006912 [Rhamnusium bicolor]|uniref:SAM domain-containing protein n=1 Tax=Rhamnusium bicolor TaxID=1586634 RepID=A0AAV8YUY1_9CUCU|nr:hypothetical protein NQ314_006912 [Rhamnusium bicolor]